VSTGIIITVAGSSTSEGFGGFSGDNGQATSAILFYPGGDALDSLGIFYFHLSFNYLTPALPRQYLHR
jgi:hypothetical protein